MNTGMREPYRSLHGRAKVQEEALRLWLGDYDFNIIKWRCSIKCNQKHIAEVVNFISVQKPNLRFTVMVERIITQYCEVGE